ncbi:hypothetical protein EBR25_13855 [bacterium]|nr:hypothetical protein [bacterium]
MQNTLSSSPSQSTTLDHELVKKFVKNEWSFFFLEDKEFIAVFDSSSSFFALLNESIWDVLLEELQQVTDDRSLREHVRDAQSKLKSF